MGEGVLKNCCLAALSSTSRTSRTPEVTADSVKNGRSSCVAITLARVVLPTPGGPHRMNDGTLPASTKRRNTPPGPTKWVCPTTSSNVRGLSRSAKGMLLIVLIVLVQIYEIISIKHKRSRTFLRDSQRYYLL